MDSPCAAMSTYGKRSSDLHWVLGAVSLDGWQARLISYVAQELQQASLKTPASPAVTGTWMLRI